VFYEDVPPYVTLRAAGTLAVFRDTSLFRRLPRYFKFSTTH
jgi:hypothetical protein